MSQSTGSLETALARAVELLRTDPGLAEMQAAEILRAIPHQPVAQLVMGASLALRGQHERAIEIFGLLAADKPEWAEAQLELGLALKAAGRQLEAVVALKLATELKPELARAWHALAQALMIDGDLEGASAARVQSQFSTHDLRLLQAADALRENRLAQAEPPIRAHLQHAPEDVVALRLLAEIAARAGHPEDARILLERCLRIAPAFRAARQTYAIVLNQLDWPQEALVQSDTLLDAEPGNASYRNLKAMVLCRLGDYEAAIVLYESLLLEYPDHARTWLSYGHALKTVGHSDRAIAVYRKAIELVPFFGEAWWSLANLKAHRFTGDDAQSMRALLQRQGLSAEHRAYLEFALGRAHEDEREYSESFAHYAHGNALRREQPTYRTDATSLHLELIPRIYTKAFFSERAEMGADAPDPIFVVGLPRSGSTLIEQILASHSMVEGSAELLELTAIARQVRNTARVETYHEAITELGGPELRRLGEEYLRRTRVYRKTDKPFFIDKMPGNFAYVGLIQLILPNAKIIDVRRHPMACGFSNFKQCFARGHEFSYRLDEIGRYYCDYVELMAHFDLVLPGRIHRVHYEQLIDGAEAEVRRLLTYCGLPFETQCLQFFKNTRPVRTASSEQVRRPLNREGLQQWRHYEPWLQPLQAALGRMYEVYPATHVEVRKPTVSQ